MGIQGLLPFLKKIHQPVNVSQFAGCTVAIDAYCWLHKGAFSCAEKLALGEKTDQYVYYCMKFINYLLSKNIKPVMVFDGCHLPSKKNVEKSRREKRDLNRKKAAQFLREGKRAEARECLQRSIDISPEMALELMNVCRDKGVDCIVAPYEADSQLAYLNKIGVAQLIITEDSDLLLFGCERVMFKMDHSGNGILIEQRHLNQVMEVQNGHYTFDKFRLMCILSGCDYLASLTGIGLVKANKVFKIARQADVQQLLKKLSTYLKMNLTVPQEYIDGFIAADNTFLYMLVYDPLQKKLVPLNPYPPGVKPEDMQYAGAYIPREKAFQIALGNINIYNGEKFANFDPETFVPKYVKKKKQEMLHMLSMWNRHYRIKPKTELTLQSKMADRPVLQEKEVVVKSHFKKHSPHKRLREVEDGNDVRSNTELSDLYGHASPAKKKPKLDTDLQRFMFASQTGNQSDSEDEEKPVITGPMHSPVFFNSLSSAHPELKTEIGTSQELDTSHENDDLKSPTGDLKSPTKNRFAHKSPGKKPKFNLNATKPIEVKSRFFANSVSNKSPKKAKADISKCFSVNAYRPVHSNSANEYNNSTSEPSEHSSVDNSKNITDNSSDNVEENQVLGKTGKPFKFSKLSSAGSEKSSPSPRSAFNWSKFKFPRQESTDSISQSSQGSNSSKGANKQFKKVISESMLDDFLKKSEKEDTACSLSQVDRVYRKDNCLPLNKCASEGVISLDAESRCEDNESRLPLTSSCTSIESFPYSIDSDCLTDADFAEQEDSQIESQKSVLSQKCSQKVVQSGNETVKRNGSGLSLYSDSPHNSQKENESDNVLNDRGDAEPNNDMEATEDTPDVTDPVVFVIESDDEGDWQLMSRKSTDLKKKTTGYNSANSSKVKPKSGCRVSGLSRKSSSKKSSLKLESGSKQASLKDMFSKFAHTKSSEPKLRHGISTEEDVIENVYTPEGNTSLINKKHGLQKNLLQY